VSEQLISIVRRFAGRKVVVLGDAIADKFVYGSISRVSREAPVFILRHEQTETVPGGAANCAMNLAALGAKVSLVAVVGDDDVGAALRRKLVAAGINTDGVLVSNRIKTTTKERILAGQTHSTKQQVIRIDYEDAPLSDEILRSSLSTKLREQLNQADAAVISDYNYGVVDENTIGTVRNWVHSTSLPAVIDSRFRLSDFKGFTAATPNEDEVEHLIGQQIDKTEQLEKVALDLKEKLGLQALLITRGSLGMLLIQEGRLLHIPAVGADQPVDVTGAGDTVIATFALALSCEASFEDAARLANYAGGLVVMKRGTASVSAEELAHSIRSDQNE